MKKGLLLLFFSVVSVRLVAMECSSIIPGSAYGQEYVEPSAKRPRLEDKFPGREIPSLKALAAYCEAGRCCHVTWHYGCDCLDAHRKEQLPEALIAYVALMKKAINRCPHAGLDGYSGCEDHPLCVATQKSFLDGVKVVLFRCKESYQYKDCFRERCCGNKTPFQVAATECSVPIMRYLARCQQLSSADVNDALMNVDRSEKSEKDRLAAITELVEHHYDDLDAEECLVIAVRFRSIPLVRHILDHGVSDEGVQEEFRFLPAGTMALCSLFLEERTIPQKDKSRLLKKIISQGDVPWVQLLIEHNAPVENEHLRIVASEGRVEVAKILVEALRARKESMLEKVRSINDGSRLYPSALRLACDNNNRDVFDLLLKAVIEEVGQEAAQRVITELLFDGVRG